MKQKELIYYSIMIGLACTLAMYCFIIKEYGLTGFAMFFAIVFLRDCIKQRK